MKGCGTEMKLQGKKRKCRQGNGVARGVDKK
jgi:hypothetical protein